ESARRRADSLCRSGPVEIRGAGALVRELSRETPEPKNRARQGVPGVCARARRLAGTLRVVSRAATSFSQAGRWHLGLAGLAVGVPRSERPTRARVFKRASGRSNLPSIFAVAGGSPVGTGQGPMPG